MSEIFQCGNVEALMGYLYDEAGPDERRAVATHLARCTACAAEVDALNATREELDTWRPPAMALGFRIAAPAPAPPVSVGRLAPWWQRPMPAWMQAAAAVMVFAAGLGVGMARQAPPTAASNPGGAAAVVQPVNTAVAAVVSPADLASLEQRLRGEMNALRPVPASATKAEAARGDDEAVVRRVRALVEESEARQRRELVLRTAELFRDFEMQRRQDMVNVQQSLRQVEGITGAEFRQQREMWNQLTNRVAQPGAAR